jgi:beta,beta-carotene 9',10'-dioxygenase
MHIKIEVILMEHATHRCIYKFLIALTLLGGCVYYVTHYARKADPVCESSTEHADKHIGYKSLTQEVTITALPVKGSFAKWMLGSYFYNGPAQFHIDHYNFKHWFDGFGMIHKFTFNNGTVGYANKLIESSYYKKVMQTGKIPVGFNGDDAPKSIFAKLSSLFSKRVVYDNTNLNIVPMHNQLVALTETPYHMIIDPQTLATKGTLTYNDKVDGHVCTAHPHTNADTNAIYNILTLFGNTSTYQVYSVDKQNKRTVLASIPTKLPSYIHSFFVTEHYIVVPVIPFVVNPFDLLFSSKPFLLNFSWKPEEKTAFLLIKKDDGTLVDTYYTQPFFMFHQVNAYEDKEMIVLDCIGYDDAAVINNISLDTLRTGCCSKPGMLHRYTINTKSKSVDKKLLTSVQIESPALNNAFKEKAYTFAYAVSADDTKLYKINTTTGTLTHWQEAHCYPGEPTFVAKPHATKEDDGVIISIVLDAKKEQSFLLALDGATFKEVGRASVPHHIPFGFHGNFIKTK